MRKPKVTVITTSFNHEQFIAQCIKSVLAQTYGNWEQIIIDDASTDSTFKIASSFAKRDKRIKVFRHSKNFGIKRLADNYNQALKVARGEYVAILESDDYWPKDKLEKQVRSFDAKKVVFSYGDCILVNKSGFPIRLFTYKDNRKLLNNHPIGSILKLFYKLSFSIIPVTVMIRKNALLKAGGFKKDKYYPFTDIPTFIRMAITGEFRFVDEILGYYRKQQDSYWFNFASKTSAMGREEVRKCLANFISVNCKNKNVKNLHINTKDIKQKQNKYLKIKRVIRPLSLFVNRVAFKGKISPMTIVFTYDYLIYSIKKCFR